MKIYIWHFVQDEIKDISPWIIAEPLPIHDKPKTKNEETETEFSVIQKCDTANDTENQELNVSLSRDYVFLKFGFNSISELKPNLWTPRNLSFFGQICFDTKKLSLLVGKRRKQSTKRHQKFSILMFVKSEQ